MARPECQICASVVTQLAPSVACPYCQFEACRRCIQRYAIDALNGATGGSRCMQCRGDWSYSFLARNVSQTWLLGDHHKAWAQVLLDIELAQMPATQPWAATIRTLRSQISRQQEWCHEQLSGVRDQLEQIFSSIRDSPVCQSLLRAITEEPAWPPCENAWIFRNQVRIWKEYISVRQLDLIGAESAAAQARLDEFAGIVDMLREVLRMLNHSCQGWQESVRDLTERINMERVPDQDQGFRIAEQSVEVMHPCPAPHCRGNVIRSECSLCGTRVCRQCLELKLDEHTCKPDLVATVQMLRHDTKPCPKCRIRISKVDGCDQMWCVGCHTAFSWNTGVIHRNGRVHNPEYFRYFRERGLPLPVHPAAVAGAVPAAVHAPVNVCLLGFTLLELAHLPHELKQEVTALTRRMQHFSGAQVIDNRTNRDLRTQYLLGERTKQQLAGDVVRRARCLLKQNFINDIYDMIAAALQDWHEKVRVVLTDPQAVAELLTTAENLRCSINDEIIQFERAHRLTCSHLARNWGFLPHNGVAARTRAAAEAKMDE